MIIYRLKDDQTDAEDLKDRTRQLDPPTEVEDNNVFVFLLQLDFYKKVTEHL